ncbi:MAG: FtsX-like permease family protein [Promethearchaeota archaeon]
MSILLGITVASSLIIGINLSMDAMGHDILSENFEDQTIDISIHTDRPFDGNFTHFTSLFNETLVENYPEIQNIFGAMKFDLWYTVYEHNSPINWSFYEENKFDWRLANQSIFLGVKPSILNQDILQNVVQFESATGKFTPNGKEIYIDSQIAVQNNFSIGDNISIGNFFRFYYPMEENHTYSIENITIAGLYTVLDEPKFYSMFPSNWEYYSEDSIRILTSEDFSFTLLTSLWNNLSNFENYDPWRYEDFWHIAMILDHANYDYLNPRKIQVFYNRLVTDIVYSGIDEDYNFEVRAFAFYLIEDMEMQVFAFKAIASLVSVPVLLLAWILLSTNYNIIFNNRRREIGLLKTRFFTNAKLRRLYFSESLIFGTVGGLFGVGFGLLSARYIYGVFSENVTFFSLITLRSFLNSVLTGVIVGAVLSLIASIKPTLTFSKLKTIDALQKYNVEIQTRPLKIRWWDWLALIVTSLAILFSIILDPDKIFGGPFIWEILLYILLPIFSVILPLSPFILSWVIAKFFSTYSLGFFTKAISKVTRFFNRKTDFFVTRSITRNKWRSTRIVAIIAIALSFLFIADITASTEIQYQQDSQFVYTAGDAAFEISTTNISREELWGYADSIMAQDNLSISHSSVMSTTKYFSVEGGIFESYGRATYLNPENYTNHVGDIDRFLGGDTEQLFNTLNVTPNGAIVPEEYIKFYGFSIGDSVYVSYLNSSNSSIEITQEIEIVGVYKLLPGIHPYYSYNNLICKDPFPFLEIDHHTWLVNYDSEQLVSSLNDQTIQAMRVLNPSIIVRSLNESDGEQLFSLLSFLEIEKYYFLILVGIGIAITMYNSIQEKSLDFGLLRARGVERWTIVKTQLSEGLVLLTLGAIISLNGLLSAWALNNALEGLLGSVIPRTIVIPIWRILLEMGGSILIFSLIIIISSLFVLKQSSVKKISDIFRTA